MKKLTPDFYVHLTEHLENSISGKEIETIHYMALSDSNASWQNAVMEPDISNGYLAYDAQKKIIVAKKISPSDVSRMIKGYFFTPGTVYEMFRHDRDMSKYPFYIAVEEPAGPITVWKCIYNNNGLPATVAPVYSSTSEIEKYHITSDGYMWKFMYRVSADKVKKFRAGDMIPIEENISVKESAIPGSIDAIQIESVGSQYNSYSYGTFKQIQVAGDPLIYSLATAENENTLQINVDAVTGSFELDPEKPIYIGDEISVVSESGLTNDALIAYNFQVRETDGISYVSLLSPLSMDLPPVTKIYQFDSIEDAREEIIEGGETTYIINLSNASSVANISSIRYRYIPTLSANTDFYKNSSIYIRSGRGAGQLRTVAEYIVSGNERRIMLDAPFDVVPTISSRFEILPRIIIQGDGTGSDGTGTATAIPVIDNSANSIVAVQMIDSGKNYTYASAIAVANTGYIDVGTGLPINANSAVLFPILPPKGGHGSNAYAELYSSAICVSKNFENTEGGKVEVGNDFGQILLMKSVQAANNVLTLSENALIFQDEEIIRQTDGLAKGIVSFREGNDLRLSHVEGEFTVGSEITTERETSNITAIIEAVDRTNDVLNGLTKFSVEIQSTGFDGLGFRPDDVVRQGSDEEENWNAEGTIFSANSSMICITGSKGTWNVSDDISGTVATMINISNGATAKITGKIDPDIILGSSIIEHIETISPVTRSSSQSETIRLVINTKE